MHRLTSFENKRILVIGDIILDEFIYTSYAKDSPEYREAPVLHIDDKRQFLGGAANVALNIKKLKATYLVGTIGNDDAAQKIHGLLQKEEISNTYIVTNNSQRTSVKSRIFQHGRAVLRMDDEEKSAYEKIVYDLLLKAVLNAIRDHKPHAIILQDYNKGVLSPYLINEIFSIALEHKIKVAVDPKFENWQLYKNADLFKPNKMEMELMVNEPELSLLDKAKKLHQDINFKNLLVTLGSEGNFIYDGEESSFHIPFSKLENPDVCGAGDTVIALAALALTAGFTLDEIAKLANKAGHIVCTKENIRPITFEELESE